MSQSSIVINLFLF